RLKEVEYFIAQQFDGLTPLDEIRRRGEERFGASLPQSTLEQFAYKLQTLGLLVQTGLDPAGARPSQSARVRGSIFYLRFKLFDPDRLLERMVPRLHFFFTKAFAWFSLATILLAAGVMSSSWQEIHQNLARLYRPETLALAWISLLVIVMGHEFSHGLTCKRFGGRVHEIGLLLIYL